MVGVPRDLHNDDWRGQQTLQVYVGKPVKLTETQTVDEARKCLSSSSNKGGVVVSLG